MHPPTTAPPPAVWLPPPKVFTTETGRRHVLMTVMVDRDYRNVTPGERDSDAVPVASWLGADRPVGAYELVGKGNLAPVCACSTKEKTQPGAHGAWWGAGTTKTAGLPRC